jgi:hypothetical protein
MLRKIVTLISIGLIAGVSAENSDKLDQIQKSLDKIVSKAGISFDGEVKSQYLSSHISGDGSNTTVDRQNESNEFTSVDFDIKARPNEMISGRVNFRMHQNWQNFFSDVGNPIFTRWISIDANVKDMVSFHVGDFKDKYSPLTLSSPDIEILNEPYIFSRQRQIAMDEQFVGNNDRVLQGINLKIDAEIVPLFNEFHLGLIGSRLRNIETDVKNGSKVTSLIQACELAKYFVGGNLDLTLLKGINLGGTYLYIFDQKNSYRGTDSAANVLAQRTNIISGRPGIDITKLFGVEDITLKFNSEVAVSMDDSTRYDSTGVDTSGKVIKSLTSSSINGSAINISGEVGISPSNFWGITLDGSFIMNSKNYRNELAQSPSFIGDRIMNKENNSKTLLSYNSLYNTFDALDHYVFKFAPVASGPSNRWSKAPFSKNSYGRSIYTQDELSEMVDSSYFDPALQLVMPFGPATPNRVGISLNLKGSVLNNGIEVTGLLTSLKEKDEVSSVYNPNKIAPKADFSQLGGGVKVDFSKMIPVFKYPFEISGSYVMSGKKRAALDSIDKKYLIESNLLNAGLYYKFYKRAALLAGYQLINNKSVFADTSVTKLAMGNRAFGIEWKVSDGAEVVATYGQMLLSSPERIGAGNVVVSKEIDVCQDVIDLSLRIRF